MSDQKKQLSLETELADSDDEYEELDPNLSMQTKGLTDRQIEQIFDRDRFRLHQDLNDFTLPQVMDFVQANSWINIRPEFQRRLRWDKKRNLD